MQDFFKNLPSKTLRGKFLTFNIPIMLLALTCVFMVFAAVDYRDSMEDFNARINYLIDANKTNLGIAMNSKHSQWQKSIVFQILQDPNIVAVTIQDPSGKELLTANEKYRSDDPYLTERNNKIFYQNNYIGTLKIAASARYHLKQVGQRLLLDLYLSMFSLLVVTLSALIVNRYTIDTPLEKLLNAIELTKTTKMNHTVSWDSKDEIGSVVAAFNEMQLQLQRQTDQLTVSKEQAIAGNTAKSEFIANISHELRTPMHVIIGLAKLCLKNITIWSQDKLKDSLEDIRTSSERLLMLVNELLDISKLEAGKMHFEFGQHNLLSVTELVLRELDPLIVEKQINIIMEYKNKDNLYGVFDYSKIGQVIRNLLSNAIKFSYLGGDINIALYSNRDNLKFSIVDNGIGIPEKEVHLIFDKFAQSSKTKTGAGGTGLGLAISKDIISTHGGVIYALNNYEHGTTFVFTIPKELK